MCDPVICSLADKNAAKSIGASVARVHPGVAPWIVGAVETVVAHRLPAQRRRADEDRGEMVRGLRAREFLALLLEELARVGGEREVLDVGRLGQPLLVEARRIDRF